MLNNEGKQPEVLDQIAAVGRPRVHRSLEHTFKDRVKMTAEPGGEVLSCISTYRYPCPTPAAEGGQEQKGHLCTPFSPK